MKIYQLQGDKLFAKTKSICLTNVKSYLLQTKNIETPKTSKKNLTSPKKKLMMPWIFFSIVIICITISSIIYYFLKKNEDISIVPIIVVNFILCCIIVSLVPLQINHSREKKSRKKEYNYINKDLNSQ